MTISMLDDLLDPLLDARHKAWPTGTPPLRASQVGAQGWQVLAGDLPLPLAVIRRDALAHNLDWMRRFCAERGIVLAPHGKTTMSPQLFTRQLAHEAWGLTVATVAQARIAVAAGARRVLIANQVLQADDLAGIGRLLVGQPGLRVLFLIDSPAQLALIEASRPSAPLEVLLELGLVGARTGCRTHEQALALARAVRASPAVLLAGLECYEGSLATGDDARDRESTEALMQRVAAVAAACEAEGLFETASAGDPIVCSAGGSALFDLVAPGLRVALARPVQGVLRSGCYVTHDDGNYRRLVGAVNRRIGCAEAQGLQAAIEVWTCVQSVPEPGLALLTAGRRDLSYDIEMPFPRRWAPRGHSQAQPVPDGWSISQLNDQHAYLRWPAAALGTPAAPRVGDRVGLGISHPCTTFDKWHWMPIVDDDYCIVDAVTIHF